MNKKSGFTLIELLVVIAIIAVLIAFGVSNYIGVRSRAKDLKKKTELHQVKNALRLYYNDFVLYPGPSSVSLNDFEGCGTGTPAIASCLILCGGQFAVGPSGCDNLYMKQLPPASSYEWSYQQMLSGDDFCLWTTLENTSDPEIAASQVKCSSVCSAAAPSTDYVLCSD